MCDETSFVGSTFGLLGCGTRVCFVRLGELMYEKQIFFDRNCGLHLRKYSSLVHV